MSESVMKIDVLTSEPAHPIVPVLSAWVTQACREHDALLCYDIDELRGGDILFLVSCARVVRRDVRQRYGKVLVLHASDLPRGRGWSPHVWDIIAGADHITLSLIDADDPVDSGAIWSKERVAINRAWDFEEISSAIFEAELAMMSRGISLVLAGHQPEPQSEAGVSHHRKRTPDDSRLAPECTLAAAFDLLRVADPVRYPCFFEYRGSRYKLKMERVREVVES